MEPEHLTPFQVEVARIFFGLKASDGYLVAGGAALLASELIARPTDGRAEARDFADVYVLAQRFGNDALLEQAKALDAGFDLQVLAQMMGTLGRFTDDEIPLAASDLPLAKTFFKAWAEELR